jgi:hypothetical protein
MFATMFFAFACAFGCRKILFFLYMFDPLKNKGLNKIICVLILKLFLRLEKLKVRRLLEKN